MIRPKCIALAFLSTWLATVSFATDDCVCELTGTLKQPIKSECPFFLAVVGGEQVNLRGDVLKDVPLGAMVRVRGIFRTELREAQSPLASMPTHWLIFMDVRECSIISCPSSPASPPVLPKGK